MDPVLQEIYKTALDAAPFVLAAYALLWVGLFGFVFFVLRRVTKVERELAVVEEAMERRGAGA